MDIKDNYIKFYQHWLKELNQNELTDLNIEQFKSYKSSIEYLNNLVIKEEDKIKLDMLNSYKENLNFLFDDFSKIREIKLINSALALKEINFNNILESEKLFYQNLISAVKGFQKVKAMGLSDVSELIKHNAKIEPAVVISREIEIPKEFNHEKLPQDIMTSEAKSEVKSDKIQYLLIRFIKKAPPLVGIDLINYGPFEKEDIVYLPLENAQILIFEKFAEKVELS
jgi:DNA replication initiation complex subunit (GINS family)